MKYVHVAQYNAVQRQGNAVKLVESSAVHFSRSRWRFWCGNGTKKRNSHPKAERITEHIDISFQKASSSTSLCPISAISELHQ